MKFRFSYNIFQYNYETYSWKSRVAREAFNAVESVGNELGSLRQAVQDCRLLLWANYLKGKHHCTADLLLILFGFSCFTTVLIVWSIPNLPILPLWWVLSGSAMHAKFGTQFAHKKITLPAQSCQERRWEKPELVGENARTWTTRRGQTGRRWGHRRPGSSSCPPRHRPSWTGARKNL